MKKNAYAIHGVRIYTPNPIHWVGEELVLVVFNNALLLVLVLVLLDMLDYVYPRQ